MKQFPCDPTSPYKMQPKSYLCLFCSKPACFGIGWGGFYEDIPAKRRGYVWVCADHREDAEQRRDRAKADEDPFYRKKLGWLVEQGSEQE